MPHKISFHFKSATDEAPHTIPSTLQQVSDVSSSTNIVPTPRTMEMKDLHRDSKDHLGDSSSEREVLDSMSLGKEHPRDTTLVMSPDSRDSDSIDWDTEDYIIDDGEDLSKFEQERLPASISAPADLHKTHVKRVLLMYNPMSGAKRGEKIANKAAEVFEEHGIEVERVKLERKGHAEELCQTVNLDSIDVIGILGGDGTFHEGVNGMMKRKDDARLRVPIAMIPGGTGNSFSLELQGGVKIKRAVKHIMRGISCPIDIGELYFPLEDRTIYSFNSIHWGLASKVNVTAEKLRWMGKAIRYTTAALFELISGDKVFARIELEDKDGQHLVYEEEFCCLIANNIMTAAKGMKIAPDAKLNDGLIDVMIIRTSNTFSLTKIFQKFYDGSHTEYKHVEYRQVRRFSITPYHIEKNKEGGEEAEIAEELLDVDGELNGKTPFKCTMIKQGLRVIL